MADVAGAAGVACPACTFVNAQNAKRCEICERTLPIGVSPTITINKPKRMKRKASDPKISFFDPDELARIPKVKLREVVVAQAEELKRLRARIRAQEEQIKQLSLHSLMASGLGVLDADAVDKLDEEDMFGDSGILASRSPHTPPCSPASGSPPSSGGFIGVGMVGGNGEKEQEKEKEKEGEKEQNHEKRQEQGGAEKEPQQQQTNTKSVETEPAQYVPPLYDFKGEGCGTLGALPKETILGILLSVNGADMARLPRVSKDFRHLCLDESLWKTLYYEWKRTTWTGMQQSKMYCMDETPLCGFDEFQKKVPALSWKQHFFIEWECHASATITARDARGMPEIWKWIRKDSTLKRIGGPIGYGDWLLTGNTVRNIRKLGFVGTWAPDSQVLVAPSQSVSWKCTTSQIEFRGSSLSRDVWSVAKRSVAPSARRRDDVEALKDHFTWSFPVLLGHSRPTAPVVVTGVMPLPMLVLVLSRVDEKFL